MLIRGAGTATHQNASQRNPSAPVAMNAQCQPHVSVIHGTTSGVISAPMLVPELKMPVASARSRLREPFGDDLDRGGKVSRFAEAEREAAPR